MTAGELLAEAGRLGLTLRSEGGRVVVHPARALPPDLADEIRRHRDEVLDLLARGEVPVRTCLGGCGAEMTSGSVYCSSCWTERQSRTVVPFDPGRLALRRNVIVVKTCPSCGARDWHVNARGDATCRPCWRRLRAAERAGRSRTSSTPGAGPGRAQRGV